MPLIGQTSISTPLVPDYINSLLVVPENRQLNVSEEFTIGPSGELVLIGDMRVF